MGNITSYILKPARYINREWNAVHKEWTSDRLKVALCFPDIYEIGMSHLGMRIIYGVLNQEEDIICERVFAPWGDMEKMMKAEKETLFSLENKKKLREFDMVGFSLQYEMNFVDVLNMLDIGGIPVRAADRDNRDPLVIAGGPCAFNPEPMADFIDAFVIGEAEEVILEIAGVIRRLIPDARYARDELLKKLSEIKGVYVPRSSVPGPRSPIKKRIINDLDNSYFPTSPIVPYIQIVHDRIALEIMRGCPHKCKFCQARKLFHPLRIRSVKKIMEIAEESVRNTGYEEISLLSLSTGDYPYLEELLVKLEKTFKALGVKISLPSIRARTFNSSESQSVMKRAGLTFAPEAGSDCLRKKIHKDMNNAEIIQNSRVALKSGWKKVKLYFMIGLPEETCEDLDAIAELSSEIKNVSLSISPFIPKPHSGFEREGMDDLEALRGKEAYLGSRLRAIGMNRRIKADFHNPEMSRIEAILSRGDRKMGSVIYKVWQKGARLQAWTEYFDYGLWRDSFGECGIDPDDYLKKKTEDELLPWGFIDLLS